MEMIAILVSVFNGWAIGANDGANSFGTWIGARIGKVGTAMILCGSCALAGALLEGGKVSQTLGSGIIPASYLSAKAAAIGMIGMGIWMFFASYFGLPVSSSHAVVGSIIGVGLAIKAPVNWNSMWKIILCWFTTPTGACLVSFLIFIALWFILTKFNWEKGFSMATAVLMTISSCYVAYSWGANDVGNSIALLSGSKILPILAACALGGLSMYLGVMTFGARVAVNVGFNITRMTKIMAIYANLGTAITVHFFTYMKMPVSTSNAIVGAVAGVGLARGIVGVNMKLLKDIIFAWVLTPVLTGLLSYVLMRLF